MVHLCNKNLHTTSPVDTVPQSLRTSERNVKVTSIYEGTNGIQAMDLLGRKLGYKQGAVFLNLLNEMRRAADRARELPPLKEMADRVAKATDRLGGTAMRLGEKAASPKIKEAFAYAKPFFDVIGDMCLAWMHLWRATVAAARLEKIAGSLDPAVRAELAKVNKEAAFYEGVLQTAKFYLNVMLPVTVGNMIAIDSGDTPLLDIPEASLGNI